MIEAILNGKIIEAYPDQQRFLICGQAKLTANTLVYLHVVCEYADLIYVVELNRCAVALKVHLDKGAG